MSKKTDTSPPAVAPAADGIDERSWYWIGCDLDGPQQRYQIAGVTFPHRVDKTVSGENASEVVAQLGTLEALTADQIARITRNAHREVVRSRRDEDGTGIKLLLDAATRRFVRNAGDYPVGMHVYMQPVSASFVPPRLDGVIPERLIKNKADWQPPEKEVDPIITAERERAKIQAEAIAQAVSSLRTVAK